MRRITWALFSFDELNKIIYIKLLAPCLTHKFLVYYSYCNGDAGFLNCVLGKRRGRRAGQVRQGVSDSKSKGF